MQAYSLDLRQRVVQALAEPGARQAQVAARFCVSVAFVGKLVRCQDEAARHGAWTRPRRRGWWRRLSSSGRTCRWPNCATRCRLKPASG